MATWSRPSALGIVYALRDTLEASRPKARGTPTGSDDPTAAEPRRGLFAPLSQRRRTGRLALQHGQPWV